MLHTDVTVVAMRKKVPGSYSILMKSSTHPGVFSLGVPVDDLFFIGNQLVATSHTGKVGVWNAVTQHWQVQSQHVCTASET